MLLELGLPSFNDLLNDYRSSFFGDGTLVLVILLAPKCEFGRSVIVRCYICSILMLTEATLSRYFILYQCFSEFSLVMDLLLSEKKTILFYIQPYFS
jgi:hypothetical protein